MTEVRTDAELEALWDKCREAKTVAELQFAARVYEKAGREYMERKKHEREPARVIADEIAGDGVAPTG